METDYQPSRSTSISELIKRLLAFPMSAILSVAVLWLPSSGWSSGVVTNCTETDLRKAMIGGGTVVFACDGVITLTNTILNETNAVLDGNSHQVTISGNGLVRVFYVKTNVSFTLINVTIANGHSTAGGAIYNDGGTVNLYATSFLANTGTNIYPPFSAAPTLGGAIFNAGSLHANHCTFLRNTAAGRRGLDGTGGHDITPPGSGNPGDDGQGGAIYNQWSGSMFVDSCLFASNSATGGAGGNGGNGATDRFSSGNQAGGAGGPAGWAHGAAIYSAATLGSVAVTNCTFVGNTAAGGNGGRGGIGGISSTTGFRGGNGGASGCGEAVIAGTSQMASCTLAFNTAISGNGGQGGAGTLGSVNGSDGTVCPGSFGGLTGGNLINTLLATNGPGGNVHYTINDLGHNLSSDSSGNLTNAGSLNSTNPKLSPLARNGGATLSMALLAGSPAIDAANTIAAPATDQRGFPRPSGHAADIGAFEYGSTLPALGISQSGKTGVVLRALGDAGQSCRLFRSTDFSNWVSIVTNLISADGTMVYFDTFSPGISRRFYRSTIP